MSAAPPLGLMPQYTWVTKTNRARIDEIIAALRRYAVAGEPIKEEWVAELGELIAGERDAK